MRKQEAGSRKQGWIEGPTADAGAPQDFNRFVPSLLPASCFLLPYCGVVPSLLPASCFLLLTVESFLPCFLLPDSCFLTVEETPRTLRSPPTIPGSPGQRLQQWSAPASQDWSCC